MSTRRDFLLQGAGTLGSIALTPHVFFRDRSFASGTENPALSLFFDAPDVERMRTTFETVPQFVALKERLEGVDRQSVRSFIKNELRHNDQLFHIVRLSDTAQQMALYYTLTGDTDAAALSAECIREINKFDRWDYFLEAGQHVVGIQRASSTMISVAVSSDWLGDFLSADERSEWLSVMHEKGCEACFLSLYGMRYPDSVVGWTRDEASTYFEHRPWDRPTDLSRRHLILDTTNLKAVPASALAIGSVASRLHFGESDDTARWTEQAVYSLSTFKDFFSPDGSYHEGVSYANYTALNIIKATSVLNRHGVADLTDIINWPGHIDFAVGMSMPTAYDPFDVVNFGDNGNAKTGEAGRPKRTAVSMWVASTFKDPKAQWFGLNLGGVQDEWALIWYDPDQTVAAQPQGNQLWRSDLDWLVARTGFHADDLTVAMRSGGPGNHEHADRNSIIVKDYGEQLVVDPYRPPYGFKDPRWMMRTTAGHSAVLIDGQGHQYHDGTEGTNPSDAQAHIVRSIERNGYCYWTSDATPAYSMVNSDVASVMRSVFVHYGTRVVLVFDSVKKTDEPSTLEARFFGYNHDDAISMDATETAFSVKRPLARLDGMALGSAAVSTRVSKLPIPDEEARKHPFVSVTNDESSLQPAILTVLKTSRKDGSTAQTDVSKQGDSYVVSVVSMAESFDVIVRHTNEIPEFVVVPT